MTRVASVRFARKPENPALMQSLQRASCLSRGARGALAVLGLAAAPALAQSEAENAPPRVLAAHFDNDINPVTQDYIDGQLDRAEDGGYDAFVLVPHTPGGLSTSMRGIVKRFLSATVPVGRVRRAARLERGLRGSGDHDGVRSRGDGAADEIGSSTPISLGGEDISKDLRRKVINDAAAYIGEPAREHDRNVPAAREMVTKASNFGARQAHAMGIVEVVAPTLPVLLDRIDGMKTVPKGYELHTADADVTEAEMSFWQRARDLLVDPNLIAIMLSIGLLGIVVELWNPGLILPGTVGAISLILGLYGLQVLPVSVAGLLLLALSAAFFVAEAFVPTHGALAVAGGVTFVLGALILFDPAARRTRCRCPSPSRSQAPSPCFSGSH